MSEPSLVLYAPLSGKLISLDKVPDEVFASKMVGDGISILPATTILKAPCEGTVINIHSSHHALTIKSTSGIDILMHIGIDTVNLKGKGFHLKTELGAKVHIGDALIEFDFSFIEKNAKSLLTEIIVTTPSVRLEASKEKEVTVGEDIILSVFAEKKTLNKEKSSSATGDDEPNQASSWEILITNPTGFHARPSALLANAASQFKSDIEVVRGKDTANAKSVTAIMNLNLSFNDKIRLKAQGPDAAEALLSLTPLIEKTIEVKEPKEEAPSPSPATDEPTQPKIKKSFQDNIINGVPASEGIRIGQIFHIENSHMTFPEKGKSPQEEIAKLNSAIDTATNELDRLFLDMRTKLGDDQANIFIAHKELLSDPELLSSAAIFINKGKSAAFAWSKVTNEEADRLSALDNDLLKERAADLHDIGNRVLRILSGKNAHASPSFPKDSVLVAWELSPSETAHMDKENIAGICTVKGGATSHVAILARTLGIPAIIGAEARVLDLPDHTEVIIDGSGGQIILNPTAAQKNKLNRQEGQNRKDYALKLKNSAKPAVTTDGRVIEVGGNIGSSADATEVMKHGGDGIGLLRSEFLFIDRDTAPSEEEQAAVYIEIAKIIGPQRKLIIRTLDIGGDKPLPYLPMPKEDNPFLGIRGIRFQLAHPDIFATQIRAVLQAAPFTQLYIMFPMISSTEEFTKAKSIVLAEQKKAKVSSVKIGLMVEVPAAAILADEFAKEADFFSLGTNDLTQYTLAMDRGNTELAKISDALDPSVLRLIKKTVDDAHNKNKFVGVCGGLAGDEEALPVLIGLGVDELSVTPPQIPVIKDKIRSLNYDYAQKLAHKLLQFNSAAEVRHYLRKKPSRTAKTSF